MKNQLSYMEEVSISQNTNSASSPREQQNPYIISASIVVAGAMIAGALMYTAGSGNRGGTQAIPSSGSAAAGAGTQGSAAIPKDLEDDDEVLGNPRAPVTIVEFGDYQCPFCKRLFETTRKEIKEKYIKTGKVKYIYRDFPLTSIHGEAQKSAEASECAGDQGKFWAYHDILFERQSELGAANYKKWAREFGLDGALFDSCLDSGRHAEEVQNDFRAGQSVGVTGTPASFVNGRIITGAVSFASFETIIEDELAKK